MNKHLTLAITSGFASLLLFFGCSGQPMQGEKVASVNNDVITEKEFEEDYNRMLKVMNLDPSTMEDEKYKPMQDMFKKLTLQNLIFNSLVAQEAEKRDLKVTDAEVDKAYDTHVQQMGGEKAIEDQLKKLGMTVADFKEELRNQLLKDKVVTAVGGDKVKVSESDIQAYYKANAKQFDEPEKVRARHILVKADPEAAKEQAAKLSGDAKPADVEAQVQKTLADKRKRAENLYAQVKAQPDKFEEIARKNSDDEGSAQSGGDLGYFSREVMVPTFSQAAFATKPGQIHEGLVQSPFGFHIIQVVDRKAADSKTYEEAKSQIASILESQRKNQVMESWLEEQKKKAKIEIEPEYNFESVAGSPQPQSAAPTAKGKE